MLDHLVLPGAVQSAGLLLLLLLLAQSAVALTARIGRYRSQRRLQRRESELFQERVLLARARRIDRGRELDTWSGWRKFEVARKVHEGGRVHSFHLVPHDGKPIPSFRPGQFLTLQVRVPGQPKPLLRCYSLSDAPAPDHYRVTVKQLGPPPTRPDAPWGLVSSYLCEQVSEGDILDVKAPAGNFCLEAARRTPLVLAAAGVGITPFLSMLRSLGRRGFDRDVWLFYGVADPASQILASELERIAAEHPERVRLQLCYSRVSADALPRPSGPLHCRPGRVGVALFRELLPSSNFDFYVCGPPAMLEQVTGDLRGWGVPPQRIFYEAFGPASVKRAAPPAETRNAALQVTFARAGRSCAWEPESGSLLELAERAGVAIESNCRAGNCGTCWVAIKSGEVAYLHAPGEEPEAGSCLACVAVPTSDLVLDA